jgi:hypothetical protein
MAMGLTLLSAPLDAVCDLAPHSDVNSCATLPADTCDGSACGEEPDQGDDNCCETGCLNCSLPCCSGTAMISTVAQVQDAALNADGRLAATATDGTWVDVDPLFHPPRG